MERTQKEILVDELQGIFNSATAAVLIDYKGLAANDLVEMRQELHKVSSTMKVLKNTLAKLAVEDTPFSGIKDYFVDTRALVYGQEDPVEQAKVLIKIAEENPNLKIHAGVLVDTAKTSLLDVKQVEALSKLPSKEALIVKLLFLFQAPATQLVRTLNEVPAKFVRTLAAVRDSKE
jgi:large subunit ribosomal protein L10